MNFVKSIAIFIPCWFPLFQLAILHKPPNFGDYTKPSHFVQYQSETAIEPTVYVLIMYDKIKPVLTMVLLFFAGVTLAVQIAKEFWDVDPLKLSEGLNVVCTHATTRCPTCLTMERLTQELLAADFADMMKAGKIVFREVNYEHPEANEFADRYKVATASVVLVYIRNGIIVSGINLANEAWKLHTDAPAFKVMLKENIDALLQGRTIENDASSGEINLEGDDFDLDF